MGGGGGACCACCACCMFMAASWAAARSASSAACLRKSSIRSSLWAGEGDRAGAPAWADRKRGRVIRQADSRQRFWIATSRA